MRDVDTKALAAIGPHGRAADNVKRQRALKGPWGAVLPQSAPRPEYGPGSPPHQTETAHRPVRL